MTAYCCHADVIVLLISVITWNSRADIRTLIDSVFNVNVLSLFLFRSNETTTSDACGLCGSIHQMDEKKHNMYFLCRCWVITRTPENNPLKYLRYNIYARDRCTLEICSFCPQILGTYFLKNVEKTPILQLEELFLYIVVY